MEASSTQQYKEKEPRVHRPYAFDKVYPLPARICFSPKVFIDQHSNNILLDSIFKISKIQCCYHTSEVQYTLQKKINLYLALIILV